MNTHLYDKLDGLFHEYDLLLEQVEKDRDGLRKNVEENTVSRKYGLDSLYGGYFCPSLVMDKIAGGFKRGRLLNSVPKNRKTYSVYEIDKEGKLLRIQSVENMELSVEHYIVRKENIEYCVGTLNGKKCPFVYGMRSLYSDGRIRQLDIINSKSSLWSEQYEYEEDRIVCRQYYYVPELKGAKRSIPIGEKGCPIALYIMNFKMNEQNKITWLEHGQYIRGKLEIDYEYQK